MASWASNPSTYAASVSASRHSSRWLLGGGCIQVLRASHNDVSSVSVILLGCLDSPRREEVAAIRDLDALINVHLEDGAREWPSVALAPAAYLRHLADKLRERAD